MRGTSASRRLAEPRACAHMTSPPRCSTSTWLTRETAGQSPGPGHYHSLKHLTLERFPGTCIPVKNQRFFGGIIRSFLIKKSRNDSFAVCISIYLSIDVFFWFFFFFFNPHIVSISVCQCVRVKWNFSFWLCFVLLYHITDLSSLEGKSWYWATWKSWKPVPEPMNLIQRVWGGPQF